MKRTSRSACVPKRSCQIIFAALCILCLDYRSAYANINLVLSWTSVSTILSDPQHSTHRKENTARYTLNDRFIDIIGSSGKKSTGVIGLARDGSELNGEPYRTIDRISNGGFVVEFDYIDKVVTVRVTTNGVDSCKATRTIRLKPGYRYISWWRTSAGDSEYYQDFHYENVTCSLSAD